MKTIKRFVGLDVKKDTFAEAAPTVAVQAPSLFPGSTTANTAARSGPHGPILAAWPQGNVT